MPPEENRAGWHKEDIKAAIRKRGKTLGQLALDADLYESAIRVALITPSYMAEQVIAAFIEVPAHELWPERYDEEGNPLHPQARKYLIAAKAGESRQNREAA